MVAKPISQTLLTSVHLVYIRMGEGRGDALVKYNCIVQVYVVRHIYLV